MGRSNTITCVGDFCGTFPIIDLDNIKILDQSDIIRYINIYDKEIDKDRLIRLAVKLEMKDYILNLLGRDKNE